MTELTFIRTNRYKWHNAEWAINDEIDLSPQELADTYTDISGDLSFARSHFPNSRIVPYLNDIASHLHYKIFGTGRRHLWREFVRYWSVDLPMTFYRERRALTLSLVIFLVSVLIGAFSQLCDPDFATGFLGQGYMNITMDNIRHGNPMAIYASDPAMDSFIMIMYNNVRVAFLMFVYGIFTSIGTGILLLNNGVMAGCFEAFFYQQGLLGTSLLAVMLHGTLELSAIVIAGAAGIVMGNGWLFPGTYPRMVSFRRAAKRGLMILMGTVPMFIVAAFVEGFLTRYTDAPDWLRLGFIILSLAFVIVYAIIWPVIIARRRT